MAEPLGRELTSTKEGEAPSPGELVNLIRRETGVRSSEILFGFDFDGTLVELAETPAGITVPDSVPSLLRTVSEHWHLAIVTGRALGDLETHLGKIPGLDLIGNHGAERWTWKMADGKPWRERESYSPEAWVRWRESNREPLLALLQAKGGRLEDKVHSWSIHYRESGREFWQGPEGRSWLESRLGPGIKLIEGLSVWNVLPEGISKGEALLHYCAGTGARAIAFFGDERTDETVFAQSARIPVYGFKVGEGETLAKYRLPDVNSARAWLAQLSALDSGLT